MAPLYFLIFALYIEFGYTSNIYIQPNETAIIKYIGDSAHLSCILHNDTNLPQEDFELNWIIPNNGEDRVVITEAKNRVEINISNLKETDHGNYSCHLLYKDSSLPTIAAYLYLAVQPRGLVSSCEEKSFLCEKSLCIPLRYKCDSIPDCPNGNDESYENCGSDACHNKLACDDDRCLSPEICCREPMKHPPNCTIRSSIRCCRQLVHPAILDQDLFYILNRPKMKRVSNERPNSTLVIGAIVIITSILLIFTFMGFRLHICISADSERRSRFSFHSWNLFAHRRLVFCPNMTNQNLLQSGNNSYFERTLQTSNNSYFERADRYSIAYSVPTHNRSLFISPSLNNQEDCSLPPSYNEVISDPPPPPYSCQNNFVPFQEPTNYTNTFDSCNTRRTDLNNSTRVVDLNTTTRVVDLNTIDQSQQQIYLNRIYKDMSGNATPPRLSLVRTSSSSDSSQSSELSLPSIYAHINV